MFTERTELLVSTIAALALGLLALAVALGTGSAAVLLDGVFNLCFFVTALATLRVAKLLQRPDDARYPFGYVQFEPLINMAKGLLILGVGLPKPDRQRWLVEKATELGILRLVPLASERSQIRPSPAALEKLRRAVVEASKQCGRNRLMEIAAPQELYAFFASETERGMRLIAHPGGQRFAPAIRALFRSAAPPPSIHLAIGPEGGFTAQEIELAHSRAWSTIDLGPRVLRVETAAIALAAAIVAVLPPSS